MIVPNAIYVADQENSRPPFAYFTRHDHEPEEVLMGRLVVEVKPLLLQAVLGNAVEYESYRQHAGWVTPNCWTNLKVAKYLLTTPKLMVVDVDLIHFKDDKQSAVLAEWEKQGSKLQANPFYMEELNE